MEWHSSLCYSIQQKKSILMTYTSLTKAKSTPVWPLSREWEPMDTFGVCTGSFAGAYNECLQCKCSLHIYFSLGSQSKLHPGYLAQ